MSPWSNAAPTLRCGIRTVGTGVSPARYAHRCRGGRPRSRARPHIPSRIAPSGFHTCGPRTAAARTAYARQAHPRLRRDTAMPRRRIPRAGHFNIMLARIPPSSSSTIISPCGHGALRYSDRRVYAQFPMGIASMLLLVSQQVLVGRGDRAISADVACRIMLFLPFRTPVNRNRCVMARFRRGFHCSVGGRRWYRG